MSEQSLEQRLLARIDQWDPLKGPARWDDAAFNALAQEVFAHQFAHNAAYRRFCEQSGRKPEEMRTWQDVPAVPTDAFKHVHLSCTKDVAHTFLTSGTTRDRRGAHHFASLDLYRAALHGPFVRHCLPDLQPLAPNSLRLLLVAPSPQGYPEGSLSFMLGELLERWGDAHSRFLVHRDAQGQLRADFDALSLALERACHDGQPTFVMGTAFAFVEFFDAFAAHWPLPPGSRVMETGGLKGRTREVSREELYELIETRLGVGPRHIISEYSMTELSSQAYRQVITSPDPHEALYALPPWARVDIVDPLTLAPRWEPGARGLIRWTDLANLNSVAAVQTSDIGIVHPHGQFAFVGRAPDAELRGCNLTMEEILRATS